MFNLYTNFITEDLKCGYHVYADDIVILKFGRTYKEVAEIINRDVQALEAKYSALRMRLNGEKTQALLLGSHQALKAAKSQITQTPCVVRGSPVTFTESVTYLVVHIDGQLTWRNHIAATCRNVGCASRALKISQAERLRCYLSITQCCIRYL